MVRGQCLDYSKRSWWYISGFMKSGRAPLCDLLLFFYFEIKEKYNQA